MHDEIGETGIYGGPGNSTINGFSNSASNRAHENSPGSPRVHGEGLDGSGAGADVGPRAAILLGHQQEWRKKYSDNGCFHIFSLLLFHAAGTPYVSVGNRNPQWA